LEELKTTMERMGAEREREREREMTKVREKGVKKDRSYQNVPTGLGCNVVTIDHTARNCIPSV
jgi:hypothetical protein